MITTARRLCRSTRERVSEKIEPCEKRGGVSASLFLDTQMNDALPGAKCLFFFGGKRKWKGMLSVFYPTPGEAEFTVAAAEKEDLVLPALFRAALKECDKYGVEERYTVVNPALGFRYAEECGVKLTYSHSEYFLCRETAELVAGSEEQKDAKEASEVLVPRGESADVTLQKFENEGEPVRCCLCVDGEEATECFLSPFDGGAGWYLYHLETKEAFRRQGLATRLIYEVSKDIVTQGANILRLQVSSKNVPAERLYRKLGFRTEEQRDYYITEKAERQRSVHGKFESDGE